ncbi:hypothetical protein KCP76_07920 [Salmonella enterica subsp. enterica serovar Weltevreden]|nr:hypothetical protein KCP76_07920 [Salmonella enterica subsp. enterica serovar Weltevreden]
MSWRISLLPYAKWMGFTRGLRVSRHPFDGSWGYQPTGTHAPTRRFGTRDDFRYSMRYAAFNVILDGCRAQNPMNLASRV